MDTSRIITVSPWSLGWKKVPKRPRAWITDTGTMHIFKQGEPERITVTLASFEDAAEMEAAHGIKK